VTSGGSLLPAGDLGLAVLEVLSKSGRDEVAMQTRLFELLGEKVINHPTRSEHARTECPGPALPFQPPWCQYTR
jgi:hypothetical protein